MLQVVKLKSTSEDKSIFAFEFPGFPPRDASPPPVPLEEGLLGKVACCRAVAADVLLEDPRRMLLEMMGSPVVVSTMPGGCKGSLCMSPDPPDIPN